MIQNRTYILILTLSFLVFCVSCTDQFREMNTDKSGISDEDMEIDFNNFGFRLGIIQQGIYFNYDFGKGKNWPFQLIQNLNADMYSGYMHDAKPLNGGSNNSDYNLQDGWNSAMWLNTYAYIFPQIYQSEIATRDIQPAFFAITKILKAEVMHRVTDYYGPVIYTHFGNKETNYLPDSQEEVYGHLFSDLDSACSILTNYIEEDPTASEFERFDILLDGKYSSWIKFANSLRMRLAIRIANIDPNRGRREFNKALTQKYGVLENESERVAVTTRNGYTNPLGEINRVWNEVYMNASMESILNGYNDPRKICYFEPCTDSPTRSSIPEYRGIRQGSCFSHNRYSNLSKVTINQSTDAILMTAAEVWFLRAEAALRNWTTEPAGECYANGVKTSFRQWGVTGADTYLQSDSTGADFIDVYDPENNIEARCGISPRWQEEAGNEIKLEKIITQKWLALFPEGCEAWAEQRRTGYPRLFPVRINNSKNGSIDTELMIRRLNFPGSLSSSNPKQYEQLLNLLQGPDHGGTRLWWDTGKNF